MEFRKYSSLENSYREAFVARCHGLARTEWVALEKIHGANFNFTMEFDVEQDEMFNVTVGKRTQAISPNATGDYSFYGCTSVVEQHMLPLRRLNNYLWARGYIQGDETIIVYGELAGKGTLKTSINYGEKCFIAFDIYSPSRDIYLPWDLVKEACEYAEIRHVKELGRGTLDEMLAISPEFRSLETPEDHVGDNLAEGFVVKQLRGEMFLPTGSRACLKVKSESFQERKQNRSKVKKAPGAFTEEQKELHAEFTLYLTPNRLSNVLSKIGKVEAKQFAMVSGMLMQDAKAEFERDELNEVPIKRSEWDAVKRSLNNVANELIRKDWLNIVDGNF
ncbi:hypothetical protein NVP1081O_146 [Vibrio phage 1.081.O._10N.286.52.C2]|nr:hypothetical protein NVP1081O_146 [Vibrio phage 1.081.O._10N.286.52.C2]